MAKNIKLNTAEYKLVGVLNTDNIEEGVILLETESGDKNLHEYLQEFNGADVEFSLKKKLETVL